MKGSTTIVQSALRRKTLDQCKFDVLFTILYTQWRWNERIVIYYKKKKKKESEDHEAVVAFVQRANLLAIHNGITSSAYSIPYAGYF